MSNHLELLNQLFEPIVLVDKDQRIVHYNHNFTTFSKLSPRKLKKIEKFSDVFISVDKKIDLVKIFSEATSENKTVLSMEGEVQFSDSLESYVVVVKIIPVKSNEDFQYLICLNDLSIEKNIFDKYKVQVSELKNSYKQLVHADKLKSIGELTAGISHEISNPLTIASGSTELLEIFLESGDVAGNIDEIREAIENIQSSLLRINKITLNMKKFVYKDDEKKEYVNLNSVLNSSLELVGPSFAQQAVELKFESSKEDVIAYANELRIEQVLVNLLKNALDAVVLANPEKRRVTLSLDTSNDGEAIFIKVLDNGSGVEGSITDQIFNPFFTTKEVGSGTGMGLSLSSQIIESHQGTIIHQDNIGAGSIFTIELPGVELSSYLENESTISNLDAISELKILVIDNEISVLNLFSSLFQDESISIIGSTRPLEALNILDKLDVDVVIADYNMPEMNGSELAKIIRDKGNDVPIVYLTSEDFKQKFLDDKKKLNISSVIIKPFTKQSILDSLNLSIGDSNE
ncbi:hypothetical protein A9Q84_07920 [Halobacteriovorax marinus]|uniref:histidine kinase n=1 Tax=Halobacteriovorax marinus TaxID=97084 RepID=A0A1Y5F5W1_9BACT|nr:hypothetical protein A9Q84_07920 [Halobacteriovorax marinus]